MAGSHDTKKIEITACGAYAAQTCQAQDDTHHYEVIPLQDFQPLPPARATTSAQKYGDILASSTNEGCAYSDTSTVSPSAATTATGALSTTTSLQEYNLEAVTATEEQGTCSSSAALGKT